jgi:hypothetical protein
MSPVPGTRIYYFYIVHRKVGMNKASGAHYRIVIKRPENMGYFMIAWHMVFVFLSILIQLVKYVLSA